MYSSQLIFVVFFVMGKIRHHLVFLSQITAFYKGGNIIIFLIGHYKIRSSRCQALTGQM